MNHKNSYTVKIESKLPMSLTSQSDKNVVDNLLSQIKRGVGAYSKNTSSTKPATGLTIDEEKILLPYLLGAKMDNTKEDRELIEKYFNDIYTRLPATLEIGLSIDNNKPISRENFPLDVEQYIRYKHACGHPSTAKSEDEKVLPYVQWYIVDEQLEIRRKVEYNEIKDRAYGMYLNVKGDLSKIRHILSVMDLNYKKYTDDELLINIKDNVLNRPEEFIKALEDKDLAYKSFVYQCIDCKILVNDGNSIVIESTGDLIGSSILDVVNWCKDPLNKASFSILQNTLKEFRKEIKQEEEIL